MAISDNFKRAIANFKRRKRELQDIVGAKGVKEP